MTHPLVEALGWSIIHSLWECSIVALLFAFLNLLVRGPSARYVAGCIALLLMMAAPAVTFIAISEQSASVTGLAQGAASMPSADLQTAVSWGAAAPTSGTPSFLTITVWLWLAGVIAMAAWSAAGWIAAQRLKWRSKRATAEIWQRRLAALAAQIHLHRTVRLYESALAQVPAVIGWIRPVILVPAGALINLSARELEAVLVHELAHIRRYDYLVNLLQTAIETLLFYHPAVWWVGRRVRAEREHCCDDLAVQTCGDRLIYARALTSLEELRCGNASFAMAATGGELSSRIRRLFGMRQPARRLLPFWLLAAIPLVLPGLFLLNALSARPDGDRDNRAAPVPAAAEAVSTVPAPAVAAPRAHARTRPAPAIAPAQAAPPWPPASTPAIAPAQPAPLPAPASTPAIAQAQPTPAPPPAHRGEGYLAGLADAGYTSISVDEIIDLKQNGVSPDYIKAMLHAGFGVLSPKELIKLRNSSVPPEYARAVKSSGIRDADVEGVIRLRQYGVRTELLDALAAAGYKDVTVAQAIQAHANGLSGAALRSLREQGFKNLTLEQVLKLKRAGVI